MAKATEQQIKELERQHKIQLYYLAQANNFILNKAKADPAVYKNKGFVDYIHSVERLAQKWNTRQLMLEKAGIPKQHPVFFNYANQPIVNAMVADVDKEKNVKGIGFIPLLIWAVVAIVGFFTAEEIVDETTTTTQEQGELLEKTNTVCKDLNLAPAECQKLIQQQTEAPEKGGSIFTPLITFAGIGVAAYLLIKSGVFDKKSSSPKPA